VKYLSEEKEISQKGEVREGCWVKGKERTKKELQTIQQIGGRSLKKYKSNEHKKTNSEPPEGPHAGGGKNRCRAETGTKRKGGERSALRVKKPTAGCRRIRKKFS